MSEPLETKLRWDVQQLKEGNDSRACEIAGWKLAVGNGSESRAENLPPRCRVFLKPPVGKLIKFVYRKESTLLAIKLFSFTCISVTVEAMIWRGQFVEAINRSQFYTLRRERQRRRDARQKTAAPAMHRRKKSFGKLGGTASEGCGMEMSGRYVLVVCMLAVAASTVRAAGDEWDAAFGSGPRFANEPRIERSGLILSPSPRSTALFPGALGTTRSSPVLDMGRFESERLGFVQPGSSLEGDGAMRGLMANQYWDFRSKSAFKPTIGGGVGFGNTPHTTAGSLGLSGSHEDYPVFMFRFEAGLGYEFSESVRGGVSYRLLGAGQGHLADTLKVPFSSEWERDQAVEIGVHIDF